MKAGQLARHVYRGASHPYHWHWIFGYRQAIFDLRNGTVRRFARDLYEESDALRKSYRMGYDAGLKGVIDFEAKMNADLGIDPPNDR